MMMLRSASTPILGSLLSSSSAALQFSADSPINHHHHHHHHHLPSFSCHFSPASDGFPDRSPALGMRRTRSDGNLQSLHADRHHVDDPLHHTPTAKCSSRRTYPGFGTVPSFSFFKPMTVEEEDEQEEEEEEEEDGIHEQGGQEGQFHSASGFQVVDSASLPPLFLARGLGIDRIGSGLLHAADGDCGNFGVGGRGGCDGLPGNGGEQSDVEMYFKKMVEENPSDALFLRNYAQFLHQTKGDLRRSEEYYSRAILADPGDGDIMSQYAKVVWELHRDKERATSYFQQAVQAAPEDSHVLAAHAAFLWETEEEDEGERAGPSLDFAVGFAHGELSLLRPVNGGAAFDTEGGRKLSLDCSK